MTTWKPIALSSLHHVHVALGADMVESDGWQRPARYATVDEEVGRVQAGVGLCDVSPAGKLILHGEIDTYLAGALLRVEATEVGAVSVIQLTEDSGILDIVTARLTEDEALLITAPNQAPLVAEMLEDQQDLCAHSVDVTSVMVGVRITGPAAHRLLAGITEMDTSDGFRDMSCAQGSVAEVHGTLLRRDVGDLPSYDLYVDRSYGEYIWETLMHAGETLGVTPYGTGCLSSLNR